jgi:chromosome segregation protein
MILRKLSIFGFKSFAEKTELDFGRGMTVVIGPNGCGKSNVVDAIRWVLGEQKVTLLRSANMQDVIFSGTQQRQPLNMAEVILTIENNKNILPVEYSEVAISRRIFRNGESEYRINKVPCRLRDIHNLFLDTGVGSSAYTTIERGMIDSILSDKAEERRILFEEAAGIGKYKQRRKESLRQLDKTRQDLLRINDQVQEVDRQVRMLARHVEKARRYKTYRDDLKALELGFGSKQFRSLGEAIAARRQELDAVIDAREKLRAHIATQESYIEKMHLAALEKEKDLERASRAVSESNEKIIRSDKDLSITKERLNNQKAAISGLERDVVILDAQIEENSALRTKLEKCIIERESELEKFRERMVSINTELGHFDGQLQKRREEADTLSRQQIDLINTVGEARNTLSTLKSNLSNTLEQRERNRRDRESLETRIEEYREALNTCRRQLTFMDEENRNLLASRERLISRIDQEDQRYQAFIEREKRLEAYIDGSAEQLKFLEGLDAAFEGYEAGVKELLSNKLNGMKGIVADLIKVKEDGSIGLVEKVLGPAVQTVVFDTSENMQAAIGLLRDKRLGTACLIALDRIPPNPVALPAGSCSMRTLLDPLAGFESLADHLFSHIVITDNGEQAIASSRDAGASFAYVGRDGIFCQRDGTVVAGESKKDNAGILQRKLQMERLAGAIEHSKKEHQTVLHDKDICIITRDEAKKALVEIDEKLNKMQRSSQEQETNIRHYEEELQTVEEKVRSMHTEGSELVVKIEGLERRVTDCEAHLSVEQNRYEALEARVEEVRAALRAMEDERLVKIEHFKNTELEVQGLTNRVTQDRQDVERLTKENNRNFERKQQKIEEKQKTVAEIATHEQTIVSLGHDQTAQIEERTALEKVRDVIREEYNGKLVEIEEIANKVHGVELDQTRDEQEQHRIRERMWEAYEVDLNAPGMVFTEVTDDDAVVHQNIEMLRERLKRVGEVNMAAFEDFETESQRLKELTTQRDDLQKAVEDLEHAIRKLDKEARTQFLATFDQVQKYFSDMFTTLFEGGEANLQLEENVDPLEASIHINVRPAGKKMRGVQMLSAGERALTAISLLFALYLVKPSAYCILDELDAPLDEANTVRFLEVLKKFANNTQFIVITHNKRTMEAADVLYGVTQREFGVSTIVSVRFEEAIRQAA